MENSEPDTEVDVERVIRDVTEFVLCNEGVDFDVVDSELVIDTDPEILEEAESLGEPELLAEPDELFIEDNEYDDELVRVAVRVFGPFVLVAVFDTIPDSDVVTEGVIDIFEEPVIDGELVDVFDTDTDRDTVSVITDVFVTRIEAEPDVDTVDVFDCVIDTLCVVDVVDDLLEESDAVKVVEDEVVFEDCLLGVFVVELDDDLVIEDVSVGFAVCVVVYDTNDDCVIDGVVVIHIDVVGVSVIAAEVVIVLLVVGDPVFVLDIGGLRLRDCIEVCVLVCFVEAVSVVHAELVLEFLVDAVSVFVSAVVGELDTVDVEVRVCVPERVIVEDPVDDFVPTDDTLLVPVDVDDLEELILLVVVIVTSWVFVIRGLLE